MALEKRVPAGLWDEQDTTVTFDNPDLELVREAQKPVKKLFAGKKQGRVGRATCGHPGKLSALRSSGSGPGCQGRSELAC